MDAFWNIGQIGIYVAAYLIAVNFGPQTISPGLLISFVGYLGLFIQPLENISNYFQQLAVASSNLERIFETMDTPPSITDREGAYDLPPIQGHVKFEKVTFAYEKGHNILENFNLDVPAGKTIALVGPTGAGKTTIVNPLSRFYEVTSGRVLIDGHDINNVTLRSLRSQVCVMMQDSFVFSGTFMDNIRYARPDASNEECVRAAKAANLHEFIMQYPEGYNRAFGEKGAGLSGGEIQLLSFARAILCDPKILILDEATSSVDTQTESKIQEALEKILKNRTSFIIAHRLSTIRKADCILYISDKGILEAGSHEELMAKRGAYYELQTKR
jgi:ABC-type multidrug transport system fused ATPase/permease subunit